MAGAPQTSVSCTGEGMRAGRGCAHRAERRVGSWAPPRERGPPASCGQGGSGPRAPPARGWGVGRGARGAGRWQMKGAASAAQKFAPGRVAGLAYRRPRALPGGRAPDATAAAAPAPGGGPGRSHALPGPGAFSGRRGRARLRRGGRAVIRVIARLPAGGSSGPRCAALAPGAGGGRGFPPNPRRGRFLRP